MAQPKLLMIDEMSLGLSPLVVEELFEVIQKINKDKQLTVLLVEQDVNAALSIASRGYVIENGRITGEGDSKTLACNASIMEAYLGIKSKGT
ncbi:MAG: hypothetical protein A2Z02_05985 [Chloroflexi bacterium RBG_16_48_7]|nr:MAG: hypothetical protein A2Z02_05985 [Chloroflexi bacterium RBG_16_48_7]